MDYQTVLDRLRMHGDNMTHKANELRRKKPAKYADLKDKGLFWQSLADQLEEWMNDPIKQDKMPFSPKQTFYVGKVFPRYDTAFADFWHRERRKRGMWSTHASSCPHMKGGKSQGLDIDIETDTVKCRDCGAELGQIIPLSDIDPVFKATSEGIEDDLPDTLDMDSDLFEGVIIG